MERHASPRPEPPSTAPGQRPRPARRRRGSGALLLLVLLAAASYFAWRHETARPLRPPNAAPLPLLVAPGASVRDVGAQLYGLGLVRHPVVFEALVMIRGDQARLRAGEYALPGGLSLDQIVDKLARGDVVRHVVTFPEGSNLDDMARIAAGQGVPPAGFLAAARDPAAIRDLDPDAPDLEGYVFPDTYDVSRSPGAPAALVARAVRRFREVMAPELPALKDGAPTLRQVVTLASLVELETARPDERPRVAAVFLNRLKKKMLLQTDPTVIYALRKAGKYDGNIRKDDLEIDSPYNTYKYAGLPPGPIASPGRASLQAALHPAPDPDLYFVSRNDGSHEFSRTLAEHQRWVNIYQKHHGTPPPASPGASASPSPNASPR
jgi:peptidoglycan lytic transglycosylase G